jgi:DegV family protein with EDD domain
MTVSVVADSAASLPPDLAQSAGVVVIPLLLTLDGETFHDGDLPLADVIERAPAGFSSSGPTPGDFIEVLDGRADSDGTVVLTVARTMSSTFEAARLAAAQIDGRVEVIDTGSAAGAEGLVVLAAAAAAKSGADLPAVVSAARRAADAVRLVATLDNLDHLARSGRVPEAAAWAGRWLHVNPIFEFVAGRPRPLRPALNRTAALDRIVGRWRASRTDGARLHVAALHASDPEPAEDLLARVVEECAQYADEPATAFVAPFSAVMVAHTGPNLVGLSWWWEPAG